MKLFKRSNKSAPPLTQAQQADVEREQRVAQREPIDYSYTVFWLKHARLWDPATRSAVAARLSELLKTPDFQSNPYERQYAVDGVEGAHSGASLMALQKVLTALSDE